MYLLHRLPLNNWSPAPTPADQASAVQALERHHVLFLPELRFELHEAERQLLTPDCAAGKAKHISFDPANGQIKHSALLGESKYTLGHMMARFSRNAHTLIAGLFPAYAPHMRAGMTSYRPVEVAGRVSSVRKNDSLLHIDAFASRPTGGDRLLRVFCNINPIGLPRRWNLGLMPFTEMARLFLPRVAPPSPAGAWLLQQLGLTKGRRSPYDHCMLQLHDLCKEDERYQAHCPYQTVDFPPGSTWIAFTDATSHAATAGQFVLEQTFYLPVSAMQSPYLSPLHILRELTGCAMTGSRQAP